MSDIERQGSNSGKRVDNSGSTASGSGNAEEDYGDLGERRNRRIRIVAWVTIASLILIGGGSTLLSLLFG